MQKYFKPVPAEEVLRQQRADHDAGLLALQIQKEENDMQQQALQEQEPNIHDPEEPSDADSDEVPNNLTHSLLLLTHTFL